MFQETNWLGISMETVRQLTIFLKGAAAHIVHEFFGEKEDQRLVAGAAGQAFQLGALVGKVEASGMYLVQLRSEEEVVIQKVLLQGD